MIQLKFDSQMVSFIFDKTVFLLGTIFTPVVAATAETVAAAAAVVLSILGINPLR